MASYHKDTKNRYFVRFRWINNSGIEVNKKLSSFRTKKDAQNAYIDFISKNPNNKKLAGDTRDLTVHDIFLKYLEHQKDRVKISSLYVIENVYNKHIKPDFGSRKITEIQKIDILNWQMSKTEQGFSFKYKTKIRWILNATFSFAEMYYDIDNIVRKTQPFYEEKKPKTISIWTKDEFDVFIDNLDDLRLKTFFMTIYYTGARLGEVMALNLSDIDFNNNTININKNITGKAPGKAFEIITPKNITSYREVQLPITLIEQLVIYTNNYNITKNDTFLFGQEKPLPETTIRRNFNKVIKETNLPKIRIHDLRHSHASLLLDAGANITLIAKRLGHKNIEMTLNTYSHLMPAHENDVISNLDSIL